MASPSDRPGSARAGSPLSRRLGGDSGSYSSSVPRKRHASWENDPASNVGLHNGPGGGMGLSNRSVKKRAPKACVSCRDRKVRCDVMSGGCPCTNCRLDNVDCILKASNRGKHNSASSAARRRESTTVATARPSSTTVVIDLHEDAATFVRKPQTRSPHESSSSLQDPGSSGSGHDVDGRVHVNGHASNEDLDRDQRQGSQAQPEETQTDAQTKTNTHPPTNPPCQRDRPPSQSSGRSPPRSTSATRSNGPPDTSTSDYLVALAFAEGQDDSDASGSRIDRMRANNMSGATGDTPRPDRHGDDPRHKLPQYIRSFPPHLDTQDIDYLVRKDCLTIPDDRLRDELIRTYVLVVYPFMPAIDLEDLLTPITGSDGSSTISLLLFQAIMFASVTFIDTKMLQSRGFKNKRAARKVFFNRVKLLYSLDYETDRLTLVQSLLLMTYWYDNDSDDKHTWYWMGIAITTAQVEGLHRDTEEPQDRSKLARLRRRIWWSCVIRDRLLGLGIRRPSRIREDEFSVESLQMDDFDLAPPSSPANARLLTVSAYTSPDPSDRRAMATICIDLSRLCVIIGRILHSQYTIATTQQGGSSYLRKAIVRPRSSKEQAHSLKCCDTDLQDWFSGLSSESKYDPGVLEAGTGQVSTIRLHQTLLYMNYLTALGALHRPQVFYSGSDTVDLARKADSKKKVAEAAVAITKLAFDLQSNNQMCYAPTSSIPAFLSAALIHLLNTRASDEETRNISIGRFCQCLDALHQLQYMYAAADQAVQIIYNVLENTGLVMPLLSMGNSMVKRKRVLAAGGQGMQRGSRLFSTMASRVATAYPSPAGVTGIEDDAVGNIGQIVTAVAHSQAMADPTREPAGELDDQLVLDSTRSMNPSQFVTPNLMNIWSAAGHTQSARHTPLPLDAMGSTQADLEAWYDVGDILDPALMNFEIVPEFMPLQTVPM